MILANAHHRSDLAWGWRYLGQAVAASGDLDEALRLAERAVDLYERLVGEGHADVETRWRLARCLDEVGRIRVLIGHPSDAAEPLERAAGIFQAVDRDNPVLYGVDVVRNQLYLAPPERSSRAGPDEAEACLRRAEERPLTGLRRSPRNCYSSTWPAATASGASPAWMGPS